MPSNHGLPNTNVFGRDVLQSITDAMSQNSQVSGFVLKPLQGKVAEARKERSKS